MGIQGLLPLLKSIQKPTHLRNFTGQTLGIDAYGWLHRGTVACAIELAQGKPTRKYVDFAMNRVRMLVHFGVKPYVVFDGDYLPSKSHTEKDRSARRKESRGLGLELLRAGKTSQAHLELQKAVDVTPLMARELIEELKAAGIPYVVAPYEADSQLAYLEQQSIISGVLSEDSDLLVFGVRCLLTKLDQYGECVMVRRDDFTACREVSLVGWKLDEFRMMAMLSGCDYLPGIEKMGLKTAYRLVRKHKTVDRVVRTVQFDGKMKVPPGYLEAFTKAEQTFLYQWVFCPDAKRLVTLHKVPSGLDINDMPYVGQDVSPDIACGVAAGDLDPNTKLPLKVASRPPLASRRTSLIQTPNEKQGKPISEFFKPRRTPLAELDPNSFTPSPSQRRLLESQQGAAWSASQVNPMRPPALARVATTPAPYSAPQPLRRAMSAQVSGAGAVSPKRQRLCSENSLASAMGGAVSLQGLTSRFFGQPQAQTGPSSRRASSKKDDFELWSDDSVVDDLVTLADTPSQHSKTGPVMPSQSPKKRKRFDVLADRGHEEPTKQADSQGASQTTSQNTAFSFTTNATQSTQGVETPLTSFESVDRASSNLREGISPGLDAMRPKWAYNPENVAASTVERESTAIDVVSKLDAEKLSTKHSFSRSSTAPPEVAEDIVPASSPPLVGIVEDHEEDREEDEQILSDEEWLAMEREPVRLTSELAVKGSEDMLVPESPQSDLDAGGGRSSIDLGRFVYAG